MIPSTQLHPARSSVRPCLTDALNSGQTGQLVVQKPSVSGRVFVAQGILAWAYCEGHKLYLVDRLVDRLGLTRPELGDLVVACRNEHRQFGDYLVDMGLIGEGEMLSCLREHVHEHLVMLDAAPGPTRTLFLPMLRGKFRSRFTFTLDEVLPPPTLSTDPEPA